MKKKEEEIAIEFEGIVQTAGDFIKVSKNNGIKLIIECDMSQVPELVKFIPLQDEVLKFRVTL